MGTQFAAGQHVVYLNVYDVVPVAGNTAEQPTLATVITKVNRVGHARRRDAAHSTRVYVTPHPTSAALPWASVSI